MDAEGPAGSAPQLAARRHNLGVASLIVAAAVLTALLVVGWSPRARPSRAMFRCAAPAAAGPHVTVTMTDMGHSTRGMGMQGQMRLVTDQATVASGDVMIRAANAGSLVHELVVLSLVAGQRSGARTPGSDGKVPEAGSRGEVSRTCSPGAGSGIASGGVGWTTVPLAAGRYELICNEPGHYAAGMHAELTVVDRTGQ